METYQGPVHICIVGNAIKEVVGLENLQLYKIRHNSVDILAIASCCKAALFNHHPETDAHSFSFHPEQCNVVCSTQSITRADCDVRLFTNDWKPSLDP